MTTPLFRPIGKYRRVNEMSTTYPDIDVTDPQEPVYDEIYDEIQDEYYIEFCKEHEQEEENASKNSQ